MYKKKHLIIVAICAAVITWVLSCIFFIGIEGYEPGDTITRARKILYENYVNPLTDEQKTQLTDAAISGMVDSLGDQYSYYLNTEDMEAFKEEKEESYVGIGVSVNFDAEQNVMTIISPYDGSPAQKAGIIPGDVIVQVGDTEVTADTYEAVIDYIKEGEDEEIQLVVRRGGDLLNIGVKREEVKRQSVSYKMFGDGLGYIRVSEFIQNTSEDFKVAVETLKDRSMRGLIIDLRSNPGGYANTVLTMTDLLLPEGIIAYLEDHQGERQYFYSDEASLDIPMVVLINQGTASAAELMAGSLKAHGLATIVGEKSFGKAVGQSVYPLSETTALYLTNSRYYTPNGECIDQVGIMPDVRVPLAVELIGKISYMEPEEDAQLAQAIQILMNTLGA